MNISTNYFGEKREICDYANTTGHFGRGCFNNPAEFKVIINYGYSKDTINLCKEDATWVKQDAQKRGYKVTLIKLKKARL